MRATTHNGRHGKDGAYSAKHNDRNFDLGNAEHIDPVRTAGNKYWHCYYDVDPQITFEDAERAFYENNFREGLDARNGRLLQERHQDRVKTMDDYRQGTRTCPEETILQIGCKGNTVSPDLLWEICVEHVNWEMETFPAVRLLDIALHVDEEGGPHVHMRKVWVGHDRDGQAVVSQNKALAEMGIQLPDPDKKRGRYNNPKITYTAICRDHFLQLCKDRGLEIEEQPKEKSRVGLSLDDYKARQAKERAETLRTDISALTDEKAKIEENITGLRGTGGVLHDINEVSAKRSLFGGYRINGQTLQQVKNTVAESVEDRRRFERENTKLRSELKDANKRADNAEHQAGVNEKQVERLQEQIEQFRDIQNDYYRQMAIAGHAAVYRDKKYEKLVDLEARWLRGRNEGRGDRDIGDLAKNYVREVDRLIKQEPQISYYTKLYDIGKEILRTETREEYSRGRSYDDDLER